MAIEIRKVLKSNIEANRGDLRIGGIKNTAGL